MKFTVVGMGYVGSSTAVLLSRRHEVDVIDISEEKLDLIRNKKSPVYDDDMNKLFSEEELNISVSSDFGESYRTSDYILISTSTNYDADSRHLDTSTVESVIKDIYESGSNACIVIKSTIPGGTMQRMQESYPDICFLFAPEFLREGKAMYDQLYPSRLIVGMDPDNDNAEKLADEFLSVMLDCIKAENVPVLKMRFEEAEAVKLFSNTYLAMRVAFFNELDTFAEMEGYDAKKIIEGVCLEPRIGDHYNNPSFGYGGYCLPKDTKQLLADYEKKPQKLIRAIVEANETRMEHISKTIRERLKEKGGNDKPVVGIYRLTMKAGSFNFRESSVVKIMEKLKNNDIEMIIYEPVINYSHEFKGFMIVNDLTVFKKKSDLIIANRIDDDLSDVMSKVYTRDIFLEN